MFRSCIYLIFRFLFFYLLKQNCVGKYHCSSILVVWTLTKEGDAFQLNFKNYNCFVKSLFCNSSWRQNVLLLLFREPKNSWFWKIAQQCRSIYVTYITQYLLFVWIYDSQLMLYYSISRNSLGNYFRVDYCNDKCDS